jgi:hypothetical protein
VKDQLIVEYKTPDEGAKVTTFFVQGEEFLAKLKDNNKVEVRSGLSENGKLTIDTSNLKAGIYYLTIDDKKGAETYQMVVQK